MQLSDIDLTSLAKIHGTGNVPKPSVYHNDQYFYKVIHEVSKYTRTSLGYYVLDGLDFKWAGQEQMAIDAVGLLSDKIAPAFKEFIYDREICCGYITHRGQWLGEETLSSTEYIKLLDLY